MRSYTAAHKKQEQNYPGVATENHGQDEKKPEKRN